MPTTPQERFTLNRFDGGWITTDDMSSVNAPPNALADIQNFEINSRVLALKISNGVKAYGSMPTYWGSRIVSHKAFSVDSPSNKNLICLVSASNNLLKYSEDFEISSSWTFTAGGATLSPNNQAGPVRKGDRLTGIGATTKLVQAFDTTGLVDTVSRLVMSVYFKKSTTNRIRITHGTDTITSADASGTWKRLQFNVKYAAGGTFQIDFPDSSSDTCDIWGAQVELVSSIDDVATGYGYTFDYIKPYYIWMSDAYINGAWAGRWVEMTERRCAKASGVSGTSFTLADIDDTTDYYKNWYVYNKTAGYPVNYIVASNGSGVMTVPDASNISNTNIIIISKFFGSFDTPTYSAANIDDNFISMLTLYNEIKISLSNGTRPITIAYVKQLQNFYLSTCAFDINSHIIDVSCHITNWVSSEVLVGGPGEGEAALCESLGVTQQSADPDPGAITGTATSGGLLDQQTYDIIVTAMVGNQRLVVQKLTANVTGTGNNSFKVTIPMGIWGFCQRLSSFDIYVGVSAGDDATAYFWQKTVAINGYSVDGTHWTVGTQLWTIDIPITAYDTAQNSLLYDLGGQPLYIDTRARYNLAFYMSGRLWIANMDVESSMLRYSNVRNITEELDNFAYNDAYGYALIESNSGEGITALGQSLDGDLIIVKRRSFFVYQVQTGNIASRRLRQIFQGIGVIDAQGLVLSDIGNFFFDENDVYWYKGGYARPDRISENRIRQYWRSGTFTPIFSFFNRAIMEYWIVGTASGLQVILRYSPEYNNWNKLVPVSTKPFTWITDLASGEVIGANVDGLVTFNGDPGEGLDNPMILTHKVRPQVLVDGRVSDDTSVPKIIEEAFMEYDSEEDLTLKMYVDNETSARNTLVFKKEDNRVRRPVRAGMSANFVQFELTAPDGITDSDIGVYEFGVTVRPKEQRYGARR